MEDILTKKLTGAIFGFKNGTKTGKDVAFLLKQLKQVNPLLAQDYEQKYIAIVKAKQANK